MTNYLMFLLKSTKSKALIAKHRFSKIGKQPKPKRPTDMRPNVRMAKMNNCENWDLFPCTL